MQKRLKSKFRGNDEFYTDRQLAALIGEENSNSTKHAAMLKIMNVIIESELTERQRQMLKMYYFQRMNIPLIADSLGVNRSTVSRTISRGRKNIMDKMKYFVA